MTDAAASYIAELRRTGDFSKVLAAIPYAGYLGLSVDVVDGDPLTRLRADRKLIGNPVLSALHGGTVGALLESAAIFKLLWEGSSIAVPKTINITIDYLRSGRATRDTFARAVITKHGRRVANVQVRAWQAEESKPIAAAHAHFLLKTESASASA
jgi:acyl-coenzyme A thioesterase PaaI-like protein